MINILPSRAHKPNPKFREQSRKPRENNLQWFKRVAQDQARPILVMVGGRTPMDLRVRVAQSHLRHDMTPSYWSHVLLVPQPRAFSGREATVEVSLDPPNGFSHAPVRNAVQNGTLARYRSERDYPNIAFITLGVEAKQLDEPLDLFEKQRAVLDAVELLVVWLSFTWGAAKATNPLLEGLGLPSAAMIETVLSTLSIELTPNVPSRLSCPEAIYQAAKWWHTYFIEERQRNELNGAYCVTHTLVPERGRGND